MIPKIIHCCWFGRNPMGELENKCINSWKKYCPDYTIKIWNEDNFDINSNAYVKEAYENKKWAFVTDYVRLYALYTEGGVYMDTDVEVLKSLDDYLKYEAFSGFENYDAIPTGIMAGVKGFKLYKELLERYIDRHFIDENGRIDYTTNVAEITDYCLTRGLKLDNTFQIIDGFALFPKDYFCPKSYLTGRIECTENTITIHHFRGSWMSKGERLAISIHTKFSKLGKIGNGLARIICMPIHFVDKVNDLGFINAIKFFKNRNK